MSLGLYLIERPDDAGYDEYDEAVVAAKSEEDARSIHPDPLKKNWSGLATDDWIDIDKVEVTYLGQAKIRMKRGVVLSSFLAG